MGDLKTEPTSKVGASSKSEAPAGPGGGISSKIHDAARKTDGYTNQAKLYAPKELSPDSSSPHMKRRADKASHQATSASSRRAWASPRP